jgi:hypothetical protein
VRRKAAPSEVEGILNDVEKIIRTGLLLHAAS